MKVLVGYPWSPPPALGESEYQAWIGRLRKAGYHVAGFCLTVNPPSWNFSWLQLESRWKARDSELMRLYERLARACEGYDIFLNYTGINVHPDVLPYLPCVTAFSCFDDPEASDDLSKPVAAAYDLVLVGNIAEVATYRNWGVKNPQWWPLGFRATDYDPKLQAEHILSGLRDVDLALLCERKTGYRQRRLDRVVRAFPQGKYYGQGWPNGFLPEAERVPLLQRTKIGINIHHSSGPINFRTYYLPANGVLQVCDNKSHLGMIYKLGEEVVGFDSIKEGIDQCRYYLAHEQERRLLAAHGWTRAIRDYSEEACFERLISAAKQVLLERAKAKTVQEATTYLQHHARTANTNVVRKSARAMYVTCALLGKRIWRRLYSYAVSFFAGG